MGGVCISNGQCSGLARRCIAPKPGEGKRAGNESQTTARRGQEGPSLPHQKDARQFGERRIGSEIFYDIVDPLSSETVFAGAGRDFGDFDFERIVTEIVEQHNGVAANLTAVS